MSSFDSYMHVTIAVRDPAQLAAVYAVLAGTALSTSGAIVPELKVSMGNVDAKPAIDPYSDDTGTRESRASDGTGETATIDTSPSDPNDVDAHGHPWSADLHASTKSKTKEGLWRMKPGVNRPDPLPGFPVTGEIIGTQESSPKTSPATDTAPTPPASNEVSTSEEDDEFAAFRAAAAEVETPAAVPARKWTDADLGALCNQAALKLGDPAPIKAIIADFVPAGEVAHSRNVPADKRADFAAAIEAKAGIQFAR